MATRITLRVALLTWIVWVQGERMESGEDAPLLQTASLPPANLHQGASKGAWPVSMEALGGRQASSSAAAVGALLGARDPSAFAPVQAGAVAQLLEQSRRLLDEADAGVVATVAQASGKAVQEPILHVPEPGPAEPATAAAEAAAGKATDARALHRPLDAASASKSTPAPALQATLHAPEPHTPEMEEDWTKTMMGVPGFIVIVSLLLSAQVWGSALLDGSYCCCFGCCEEISTTFAFWFTVVMIYLDAGFALLWHYHLMQPVISSIIVYVFLISLVAGPALTVAYTKIIGPLWAKVDKVSDQVDNVADTLMHWAEDAYEGFDDVLDFVGLSDDSDKEEEGKDANGNPIKKAKMSTTGKGHGKGKKKKKSGCC